MSEKRELQIIAGECEEAIAEFLQSELRGTFCESEDEFKDEWPDAKGNCYRVTISVERIE